MPCDTIQRTTVVFGEKTDTALLAEALKALGYFVHHVDERHVVGNGFQFDKATGKLEVGMRRGYGIDANKLKREYSKQVVTSQAAKFGFKVMAAEEREVRHVRV